MVFYRLNRIFSVTELIKSSVESTP